MCECLGSVYCSCINCCFVGVHLLLLSFYFLYYYFYCYLFACGKDGVKNIIRWSKIYNFNFTLFVFFVIILCVVIQYCY